MLILFCESSHSPLMGAMPRIPAAHNGATMQDVVREIGLSVGAICTDFESKDQPVSIRVPSSRAAS